MSRNVATVQYRLTRICLLILQFVSLSIYLFFIWNQLSQLSKDITIFSLFGILSYTCAIGIIISTFLENFSRYSIINYIIRKMNVISRIYILFSAPVMVFSIIYIVMLLFSTIVLSNLALLGIGLVNHQKPIVIEAKPIFYLALVITSIVAMYKGEAFVDRLIRFGSLPSKDSRIVLALLNPNLMRVYVYGLMGITYVIANLEKFSGAMFIQTSWWMNYKDVALEVLLTVGLFDTLITLWRDRTPK